MDNTPIPSSTRIFRLNRVSDGVGGLEPNTQGQTQFLNVAEEKQQETVDDTMEFTEDRWEPGSMSSKSSVLSSIFSMASTSGLSSVSSMASTSTEAQRQAEKRFTHIMGNKLDIKQLIIQASENASANAVDRRMARVLKGLSTEMKKSCSHDLQAVGIAA